MSKISIKIKKINIMIYLLICIMIVMTGYSVFNVINYSGKAAADFEVKKATEEGFNGNYCLYINGENYTLVDYNNYSKLDKKGQNNVKMCFIIDEIETAIRFFMIILLLSSTHQMLKSIIRKETSHLKENENKLRMIAIEIVLIGIIPGLIKEMITILFFNGFNIHLSQTGFLIVILGVLLGAVSQIFKCVYELPEAK